MAELLGQDGRGSEPVVETTDPAHFTVSLLEPPKVQARSSLTLGRTLQQSFQSGADLLPQLAVQFAPRLKDAFYTAWANATVPPAPLPPQAPPALNTVYALRVQAPLFGASAPKQPTYFGAGADKHKAGELQLQKDWQEWDLDGETRNALFLDQAYPEVLPQSFVVVQQGPVAPIREVRQVNAAETVQRTAYGLSGRTTRLTLSDSRREEQLDSMALLRSTLVYAQSEPLTLADEPTTPDVVAGAEIPLDQLYSELTSGRWVIFSGERADIPGVTGVSASELLMISGLKHGYDPNLPRDKTRTTLLLATNMAYSYKRDSLTIYGNVVKATHGETRNETLGAGDGSQALQAFALKQPPLTFVPAPSRAGVDSTLKVYVNGVQWHEAATLAGLGPRDRRFITRTADDGTTTVVFGTGEAGARLPTGVANVKATYRNGIGAPGNARAEQIGLLQTRPLGVKSVINPLRASGGADRESRDQARANAPLAVMSLDRLVSVTDYADFARTFAGIGKALARKLSDGREELVHVTIAGADDIPIDTDSDLFQNLLVALRDLGDPGLPIQAAPRELKVLVLGAKVGLDPDYQWEPVVTALRSTLLDQFGFQRRGLGQPVLLSELVSRMQAVPGVVYVDVDAFGGIPEKQADPANEWRLLTLDEMTAEVQAITARPKPADRVNVNLACLEAGQIHPAQLAIFSPEVPDTLILNQII